MTATQNTPTQAQPRKPRRKAVTQPTAESVLADLQGLARDMAADDVAQRAPQRKGRARKAATPAVEAPTPTPAASTRKALPQAERRTEATHADGGSAVAHGKCTSCGARKGHLCQSKLGKPTNFVHSPRMRAWEAAGSPRPAVPFLSPLSKAGKAAAAAKAGK